MPGRGPYADSGVIQKTEPQEHTMYPTIDVQTTLTFARLHQDDLRTSYPRRRRSWLFRRADEPAIAAPRALAPSVPGPQQHRPAAA